MVGEQNNGLTNTLDARRVVVFFKCDRVLFVKFGVRVRCLQLELSVPSVPAANIRPAHSAVLNGESASPTQFTIAHEFAQVRKRASICARHRSPAFVAVATLSIINCFGLGNAL